MLPRMFPGNISRRVLLGSTLLYPMFEALGSPQASSSDQSTFPGTRFRQYSRCLPEYLATLAKDAVTRRNAALQQLTSAERIQARQEYVRELLWELIGGPETRTLMNARTTGEFKRSGYRVEKLIYESRPHLLISANLYVPEGAGTFPAVLFQSGHYWEAKAYPSYQRCCQGLVKLGFVVLAFDPMGQGERINYLNESGTNSRLSSCDSEHTVPGKQFILFGDSSTRFQLWDAIRSLDYLLSLPFVDVKRVASVGHSGGGTLTMLLSAADDRLAAAAVCMGNTENVTQFPFRSPGATDDAEQNFVYSGPAGFDRWDLLYPFAPKPLLIWPSDRDFFATYSPDYIENGWNEFQQLKRVYETLDRADRVAWADTPLPHALAYDSRLLIYNWFSRWLKNENSPVQEEPPVQPESVTELWATANGSVVRSLHSATPHTLIKSRSVQRSPAPLADLLKITKPPQFSPPAVIGRVKSRNINVEVLEISSGPEVWLPAFLLIGDRTSPTRPILLVLDERENDRLWFAPEVDQIMAEDSPVICSAEVRGVGALTPEFSPGAADYESWHQQEENYAWGSLALGKPLVGQRVTDILALVAALRAHAATSKRQIYIAALGELTVPALFAAALEPSVKGLYLAGGLGSFENLIQTEVPDYPFANYVPELLNHTDLPEIAASIAPRKILLAGAIDAEGNTMDTTAVLRVYSAAARAGSLTAAPSADWSAKTLLSYISSAPAS
jgi:pimeloyl-ACP methyl ester carboxylesterase